MESKFWRKSPIKKFNTEQTMYSLVTDEAKNDLDLDATGFMGNSMTYKELFESAEDLAKSFNAMGVKEQIIFPEIDYDKIDKVRGLDVIITTTAKTDEEGRELLKALGMPFA